MFLPTPQMAALAALARPRVSLAVGACALAGGAMRFALYPPAPEGAGLWARALVLGGVLVGATLLCAGCSALNQVQEWRTDALMPRTAGRPVPTGALSVWAALGWGLVWAVAGLLLFARLGGWPLFWTGCAVPMLYNGLYTPLKRVTCMSILVGGLAGALPPLTGWLAAGGSVADPLAIAGFAALYLWQVPHFWSLSEKYADEYERAGFPVAARVFSGRLYRFVLALWTGAFVSSLALVAGLAGFFTLGIGLLAIAPVAVLLRLGGVRRSFRAVAGCMALAVLLLATV